MQDVGLRGDYLRMPTSVELAENFSAKRIRTVIVRVKKDEVL